MKKEDDKNEYITKGYFEEHLDKRLAENNQILLGALDSILAKRFTEMREDFNQEFSIAKEEIGQIKTVIKNKLGVEIRATG